MPKYRKRPVEIDAIRWTGTRRSLTDVLRFVDEHDREIVLRIHTDSDSAKSWIDIPTLEGTMRADSGDWIIRGVQGEFYPCKPDIFATTYEPADNTPDTAELEKTTRVFAALHHSAEEDVTRVINLYEQWVKAGPPPLGTSIARWWDARLVELHEAIRPSADQPKEQPVQQEKHTPVDWKALAEQNERRWKDEGNRRAAAEAERDGAYRERARLVALVAGGLAEQVVVAPASDVDEPGWQILYATLHGRQCSWHFSPQDADLIEYFDHVPADDPRAQWDGHTTEAKYQHIDYLARALGTPGPFRDR